MEVKQKKSCTFRDLEMFIDLVEDKYQKVYTDYKELAEVINKEFNTNIQEETANLRYKASAGVSNPPPVMMP